MNLNDASTLFQIAGTIAGIGLAATFYAILRRPGRRHDPDKLRADNARMQKAARQWNRCDDAARYLDDNIRHLDDAPDWTTD